MLLAGLLTLGLASSGATAQGVLTVTSTTQPHGGNYAPKNIVATWVEDAAGNFVITIDRWAATRKAHLVGWIAKAGTADVDAVSGATRAAHGSLTATWDLRDRLGNEVPDGTYTIRMELADSNATLATQNAQGTFTFTKDGVPSTQTALSDGGFSNVTLDYAPAVVSATCGDGTVDPDETCDGNCPTACEPSDDPCMANTLVGSASSCTAACELQPVTGGACGAQAMPDELVTGCEVGGGQALAWPFALGLGVAIRRRRRRRGARPQADRGGEPRVRTLHDRT